tara:strand:+ start:768 stop:1463 length:696 start_codon:yes stop_codon:yes gene_type:complete
MSSFLVLCQKVARESGTIEGVAPSAVTGQIGRLLKVVNWTSDAWSEIQNSRENWEWMRKDWSFALSESTGRYTPASFNLTNHSRWVKDERSTTVYDTSTGVSDESDLKFISYRDFRIRYERGTQTDDRPVHWTITPAGEFAVGPKPDDSGFTATGEYYQGNEILTENADVPDLPSRFHDVIVWRALMKLAKSDENRDGSEYAEGLYISLMAALERDQLPDVEIDYSKSTLA